MSLQNNQQNKIIKDFFKVVVLEVEVLELELHHLSKFLVIVQLVIGVDKLNLKIIIFLP